MTLTLERHSKALGAPPLCEQLRIRDLIDDVAVQVDGSMVAGFEVRGLVVNPWIPDKIKVKKMPKVKPCGFPIPPRFGPQLVE